MKKWVRVLLEYGLTFALGGCGYYYLEVLTRGWSHYSMFFLGGLCFCFFYVQGEVVWWRQELPWQLGRCLLFLLVGEFVTGCMVNLWKGWNVWDYGGVPLNLAGQICAPMALVFGLLCYVSLLFQGWLKANVFGKERGKECGRNEAEAKSQF